MRILVTGSRELTDRDLVWNALNRFAPARKLVIVCGYDPDKKIPKGADEFAYLWALRTELIRGPGSVKAECHPADWERQCDSNCDHSPKFRVENVDGIEVLMRYCPVAGNLRNQEMVDSGVDFCLAFYKFGAKNRGTRDCVRRCRSAKVKVEKFYER